MTGFRKLDQLARVVGGAATVVTLTLAVTLRVEHTCSAVRQPDLKQIPPVLYPYSELMAAGTRYGHSSNVPLTISNTHVPRLARDHILGPLRNHDAGDGWNSRPASGQFEIEARAGRN
jgi:hypothetical protein